MKRSLFRFILPLLAFLPVPFIYNACNSGLLGGSGFLASKSCKAALENGKVTRLEFHDDLPPKPFSSSKVKLRAPASTAAQAKDSAPLALKAGTKLGVILDNKCLQDSHDQMDSLVISKAAAQSGELLASLDRQAYVWELDRAYTDLEIESLAATEACVVGVSWNQTYKMQSMSFNDANVNLQTHLPAINAFTSYDMFYNSGGSGGGMPMTGTTPVIIAVIDTGVDWQHPDIRPSMWAHSQGIGIDITTLGTSLVDYNPFDISSIGHGTHVSGMIAAASNNGTGIVGVMPFRAQIMGIKLFKSDGAGGLTTTSQYFYNAMKFAYMNGAQVINLSLGSITSGAATDAVAESGVEEAISHGVVVVTVIGNADSGYGVNIDGTTMSSIPGQYAIKPGVIGVGAFDTTTGDKSYFSHYSTTFAEIGAPGEESSSSGLYSTVPTSLGSYGRLSGTSQAAPQVTAAAALVIGLIKSSYNISPTPTEVERILLTSATKSAQLAPYFKNGNRLDLTRLAEQVNHDYPATRNGAYVAISSACP